MLALAEAFFASCTHTPVCDARRATEGLICPGDTCRAEVDERVARTAPAGDTIPRAPQDLGLMYDHTCEDSGRPHPGTRA